MRNYLVPVFGTLFVALPITYMYGFIALLGSLSMKDVVQVWMGTHIWKDELYWYQYTQAFSGLFGVMGIIGLWIGSLFFLKLSNKLTAFSWVVILLLSLGAIGATYQSINFIINFRELNETIEDILNIILPLIFTSVYALLLILRFVKPNKTLKFVPAKNTPPPDA